MVKYDKMVLNDEVFERRRWGAAKKKPDAFDSAGIMYSIYIMKKNRRQFASCQRINTI